MNLDNLIIYRNILNDPVIKTFCNILEAHPPSSESYFLGLLIERAEKLKLSGNIFAKYMLYLMMNDENIFTTACENKEILTNKSIYKIASHDIQILYNTINFEFSKIIKNDTLHFLETDYIPLSSEISDKAYIDMLHSQNSEELLKLLTEYYKSFGCGQIGTNRMLKYTDSCEITGIKNYDTIKFDDIVGYEYQKESIILNTKAFLAGADAHNILLVGARGTGKSSCVKAAANMFFESGLRLLEITKDQFEHIPKILNILSSRGLKFIIFMDDLSYEQYEISYKHLKSILEGGTEKKPSNVLFYATSNRRHILSEKWSDKKSNYDDEDLHGTDSVNEKLSLSDRFGMTLTFSKPTPEEYAEIIIKLADAENIELPQEVLIKRAREWELNQKGLSGRTARQFINQLILEQKLKSL